MFDLNDIKRLRKSAGLTQKELAKRSGVSQSLVAKIEAGTLDPTFSKANKIIDAINSMSRPAIRAGQIMNPSIISIGPEDTIKKAIIKMKRYNISQMPVLEDRKVVGLISETILLDALMDEQGSRQSIAKIMKDAPPILAKDASIDVVTTLLKEYPMVIVSEHGKLLGHITRADIISKAFR